MTRTFTATLCTALGAAALAGVAAAQDGAPVDLEVETASGLNGTISKPTDADRVSARVTAARTLTDNAFAAGFSGEIFVDMGGLLMVNAVSEDLASEGHGKIDADRIRWPFASVTKQILAAKMVDELDAGDYTLDTPISDFVEDIEAGDAPVPTIRQLLQHRSGLRNPEDTPVGADGWQDFYNKPGEFGLDWCLKGRAAPPAEGWSYNNCDYIVLGAAFDELSFEDWPLMIGGEPGSGVTQVAITSANAGDFYQLSGPEARTHPFVWSLRRDWRDFGRHRLFQLGPHEALRS